MSLPPYSRPSEIVQQEFVLAPSGLIQPQPAVVIGPHYRVFSPISSTDRSLVGLGSYVPGADTDYSYPALPAGGKVDLNSVKLRMEGVMAKYATLSGSNVIERGAAANQLKISTGNGFQAYTNAADTSFNRNSVFKQRDVQIGDRVKVTVNSTVLLSRIIGFSHATIAATTGTPSATSNRANQAYSGTPANTDVKSTDHTASIDTATTSYVGSNVLPVLDDTYVLECITAGAAGIRQVETATVVGTIGASGTGNVSVIVTAAGLSGSPLTTLVAVANNDTASTVAGKIRTALGNVAAITALFTVGGTGAAVSLTKINPAANDGTLNIATDNATSTGLTAAPTSANTTAGALGVAVFKIASDSGDNVAELSFANIAFGQVFDVGTRGLRAAIASAGSQAFVVGEKYTFDVTAAYTRSAPTLISDSDDYVGPRDATYTIKVVKGGKWSELPQVVVTTNNGIDRATPQIIEYNESFLVGSYGIVVKFADELLSAQNGLVLGDVYTIACTASQKGAATTAVIANPLPDTVTEGTDLSVDFQIYKEAIDLPATGYPHFASQVLEAVDSKVTVSAGIVIQDSSWLENDGETLGDLPVVSATMYLGYRALLTGKAGVISAISDLSSVSAVLGDITALNPLGLATYRCLANAAGQAVYFLPVKTDDVAGYTAALKALEKDRRAYFRIPASDDVRVIDVLESHVNAQSDPKRANECTGVIGELFDPLVIKYGTKTNGDNWTGYVSVLAGSSPPSYVILTIPGATFLTDGIRATDQVRADFSVDAAGNDIYETAIVDEVIDEENLRVLAPGFGAAIGSSSSLQRVQVVRLLTLDEQAELLRDRSAAWADRRIVNVFQEIGSALPAYAFAAAAAGLASSVAVHQPITGYTLSSFNDEVGALRGFTPDQLDIIASGGTLIITKDTMEGQVYIRHQLTTDRQDDLHAELSVTRNGDSIAKYLRDGLAQFRGKHNIGPNYIQLLDVTTRRRLDVLTSTVITQSAGTQILEWDAKSLIIERDPVARTQTNMSVSITVPLPGNSIKLVIKISG